MKKKRIILFIVNKKDKKAICLYFAMKYVHRNVGLILLTMIVFFAGMCSELERTDSCLAFQSQIVKEETIEEVNNNTAYIGNCTNKLITGLRNTLYKSRKGQERISLRGCAEFLWLKVSLHLLLFLGIAVATVGITIQSDSSTILNYIHNQDGEK